MSKLSITCLSPIYVVTRTIKRDELMHEAEILSKISSHANIITFYDSWVEKAQPRHALSKKKKKSIEDATV